MPWNVKIQMIYKDEKSKYDSIAINSLLFKCPVCKQDRCGTVDCG